MSAKTQDIVSLIIEDHVVEVEKSVAERLKEPPVKITIDGRDITVPATTLATDPATKKPFPRSTTIYDAALKLGIKIPILCHREHMTPVAVCRFCVVELGYRDGKDPNKVNWGFKLSPACQRQVEPNMVVKTAATSEKVTGSVKLLTELLLADHDVPRQAHREYGDNELRTIARQFGLDPSSSRFPRTAVRPDPFDETSVVIAVDHNACILCDRCIRGCGEIRNNHVLGRMGKGYRARIAFDLNDKMGDSNCVSCGECMVSCPTGALTNRKFVLPQVAAPTHGPGEGPVSVEELSKMKLFQGVSVQFLGWNEGAVVRKRYKRGEIICREGEHGNTAFIIEDGEVEVFIASPLKHVKTRKNRKKGDKVNRGMFGLVRRFTSALVGRDEDPDDGAAAGSMKRYIPVDAPVALDLDNPIATLTKEDLIFGEMACMNNYPRSATVRAKSNEVTLLQVMRNVLYILQRNKRSKAMLDDVYRRRAIEGHLRSVPIFASLLADERRFQQFVQEFRERMTLARLNPGEVVFRQGDRADAVYLVKVGFVKVSQRNPGGEHVLSYIGPGGYFGEIGLLADIPEVAERAAPGLRVATCAALDHVDLVKISGAAFQEIIARFPEVRDQLVRVALKRLEENEQSRQKAERIPMGEFVKQGLMNATSLLVLDLTKCTRCDECTKACSDAHDGVTRLIRDGMRFENWLVASSCRSCLDPYCMVGCPVDSIHRKPTREMKIEDWCIGCGNCAKNCPYGNINMHPFPMHERRPDPKRPGQFIEVPVFADDPERPGKKEPVMQEKATMCDLCSDLDGRPSCVYACPHDAAHRYSGEEFREIVESRKRR